MDCGKTKNLEFDHANAEDKSFDVAKAFTSMAEDKLWAELHKCVLRCKSCHILKTSREDSTAVGHGEGLSGKRNCKCSPCKDRKNQYMREYKRKRKETSGS